MKSDRFVLIPSKQGNDSNEHLVKTPLKGGEVLIPSKQGNDSNDTIALFLPDLEVLIPSKQGNDSNI